MFKTLMKNYKMRKVYLSFYALILTIATFGQTNIETQILNLVEKSEFSGSVLQFKEDHIKIDRAYGFADREKQIKNEPDFKFNLGSINKLFTKIAIAQLIQNGKLNLEDFAFKYVPEFNIKGAEKITIAHLLAMSSGLGDYLDRPEFTAHKEKFLTMEDYLPLITTAELDFEPGTSMQYSNLGYELLGIIVGRASKMDYHTYIKKYILDVAKMNDTGYFTVDDKTSDLAVGYIKTDNTYQSNWSQKSYKGTAAGGAYSTTADMLKLAISLFDHQLLNKSFTNLLFKNFKTDSDRDSYIYIAGGGPGINASFYLNRQRKEVVVVLANMDPPAASKVNDIFKTASGGNKKKPMRKK